ncbi:DEAD/DEAH box helicase [Tannockella kyphosi]|uniref:DEAD/DEAH box helicase n=1 Tax=Tannockella kyphosi TaxID=2899121 RepID=UPI002010D576|nr:DEAD/DEAH box helicase [Tannockella kyphosi]
MDNNFKQYQLDNEITKALDLLHYTSATQVQEEVIPCLLNNKDIIVKSKTGSGKTASFLIPICQHIQWDELRPQALILTPTRELAMQVQEDAFNIGRFKRLKTVALYGRSPFQSQAKSLKQKTHLAIGTPGRVMDHIQRGTLDVSNIQYLVIDEADEMLAMGFIEQVENIIDYLPQERVTVLLSATMPESIKQISKQYMNKPVSIEIEQEASIDHIEQKFYQANAYEKLDVLLDVTTILAPETCIIFCNTKEQVDLVYDTLNRKRYSCNKLHGGMEQEDRTRVIQSYKRGKFRYLIASDVASRGLDIDHISLVINYDIPLKSDTYIHRIGRSGRIGNKGMAVTLIEDNQDKYVKAIERKLDHKIIFDVRPSEDEVEENKVHFHSVMQTRLEYKESKTVKVSKDILKIHINAGKKTKMRAVDIVGTLCNIEGITSSDIGIIEVQDISTYVEILNGKGMQVLNALQNKPIKGRIRKVSKANTRDY